MNWCISSGQRAEFTLSAVRVNVDVTWSRDEFLVTNIFVPYCLRNLFAFNLLRVWSIILNGMYARILSRCINWAKSHVNCSVEFEELDEQVRVSLCTWVKYTFRRVCLATLDRYSGDPHLKVSTLSQLIDALGPDVSLVSISGGTTILVEIFCKYLGSGYR